jgi:hypothetical protein
MPERAGWAVAFACCVASGIKIADIYLNRHYVNLP